MASGLAAVTQSASVLKKGFAELDPLVAIVDPDVCTACGDCLTACPYDAISMPEEGDRALRGHQPDRLQGLRRLRPDLPGERDRPARLHRRPDHLDDREPRGGARLMPRPSGTSARSSARSRHARRDPRGARATGPLTVPEIAEAIGAPTHEVVFWVMGMRRYGWIAEIKGNTVDGYFQYEPTGRIS